MNGFDGPTNYFTTARLKDRASLDLAFKGWLFGYARDLEFIGMESVRFAISQFTTVTSPWRPSTFPGYGRSAILFIVISADTKRPLTRTQMLRVNSERTWRSP